jgi:hypothetical protein
MRVTQVFRACLQYRCFEGAKESIASMGSMGDRSLTALRSLLHDTTIRRWHPDIISAMAKAGGRTVSTDLMGVIREELSFWSAQAPNLKDGWWNAGPDDQCELRRDHYGRLLQALRSLATPVEGSDRSIIMKTRDLWQTTPALASVGDDQIVGICKARLQEPSADHK